jgi:hemerythrin-like domain-containing protein
LESGEHSQGNEPTTGVDVLEADHMMFIQLSAAMFSLFGVSGYLNDQPSQRIVIEQGIQQGVALVEKLRLHIFREDEVIFSLAQNRISSEEFDRMPRKSK